MEENITQRKAKTVGVTIYTADTQDNLPGKLSEFIAPEGKEAREFIFNIVNPAAGFSETEDTATSLDVIVTSEGADTAKLANLFKKKGRNYVEVAFAKDDLLLGAETLILELEKALDSGFTIKDFVQIHNQGISLAKIRSELLTFRNGISKIILEKPATIGDGIYPLPKELAIEYAGLLDSKKDLFKLTKFVPASGAASRMFKFLLEFIAEFDPEKQSINAYINRKKDDSLKVFLVGLDKFPFFKEVLQEVKKDTAYAGWSKDMRYYNFIKTMLTKDGFDFADKPKGILPFHQYDEFVATPVYEHLKESVAYASSQNQANVHFTISEDHLDGFLDCIKEVKETVEKESGITINPSFSYQHKQTDTIAVDMNNAPFREADGKLLFRPGGHGALIENLNRLEADFVCIKNIDNVSHSNIEVIALYKKALLGLLISLQEQVFTYLDKIERNEVTEADITEILQFAKEKLSIAVVRDVSKFTSEYKTQYVKELLNRPIRICGMVKNEGEPGGGPFWVKENGRLSLQIVESSQIDLENKAQNNILMQSTHFNPVDLVCGLKDHNGKYFELGHFIDPSTGFIVHKNRMSKDVKSYELPGLWNGAMAGWITIFVEVPLETFNPVKTVNDLLKPAHQPQ
jgi:hypothetical protein